MKIYEGKLVAQGMRVGIVASRFNEFIVSKLLSGCEDALLRHGVLGDAISVAWVKSLWLPAKWQRAGSTMR